jgi:hypothetical protein
MKVVVWMVITKVLIGSIGHTVTPTRSLYQSKESCDLVVETATSLNTIPNTSFECVDVEVKP